MYNCTELSVAQIEAFVAELVKRKIKVKSIKH